MKILFVFLIFTSTRCLAADYNVFVGAAADEYIPSAVRVGINSLEFGLITGDMYGVDQVYRSGNTYAAWGLGLVFPSGGGFFAAVGWEPKIWKALTFRAELNAVAATNALVKGGSYVGLGLQF